MLRIRPFSGPQCTRLKPTLSVHKTASWGARAYCTVQTDGAQPGLIRGAQVARVCLGWKYKNGKKQGPVRIALPFQTIETVNESAQDRQRKLDLFTAGRETGWRNRLIWGDKKYVLPSLLPEFAGRVNLIYIDPPFNTGGDFSFTATIPGYPKSDEDETTQFVKEPSILEQKAYRDT